MDEDLPLLERLTKRSQQLPPTSIAVPSNQYEHLVQQCEVLLHDNSLDTLVQNTSCTNRACRQVEIQLRNEITQLHTTIEQHVQKYDTIKAQYEAIQQQAAQQTETIRQYETQLQHREPLTTLQTSGPSDGQGGDREEVEVPVEKGVRRSARRKTIVAKPASVTEKPVSRKTRRKTMMKHPTIAAKQTEEGMASTPVAILPPCPSTDSAKEVGKPKASRKIRRRSLGTPKAGDISELENNFSNARKCSKVMEKSNSPTAVLVETRYPEHSEEGKYAWLEQEYLRSKSEFFQASNTVSGCTIAQILNQIVPVHSTTTHSPDPIQHESEKLVVELLEEIITIESITHQNLDIVTSPKNKKSVHFCTFDVSSSVFGKNDVDTLEDTLYHLNLLLSKAEKLVHHSQEHSIVAVMLRELHRNATHFQYSARLSQPFPKSLITKCAKLLANELEYLLSPLVLPFQNRLSEVISSLIRYQLRWLYNEDVKDKMKNKSYVQIKAGTGTMFHNVDNVASLCTYALNIMYENEKKLEAIPTETSSIEYYELQRGLASSKIFLSQLFSMQGFNEYKKKNFDKFERMESYASYLHRFHCEEEAHFKPLVDIDGFRMTLKAQERQLSKDVEHYKHCILKGKNAVQRRRYEKEQFKFPKLEAI